MKKTVAWVAGVLTASYFACVAYAYWPYAERSRVELLAPADHLVRVEGHALRYRSYPEVLIPERPTLLMLHGFAGSLYAWRKVAPALSQVANVIAVDIMPFGLSDKPVDYDYAYESQARILGGLIEALKLRDPIPMGHSYGGTLAAYLAWKNPRVSRVVFVDPGILATGVPGFVRHIFFPLARVGARMFGEPSFRRRFVSKSFVNRTLVTDDLVRGISAGTHMEGYLAGTSSFFAHYEDVQVDALLSGIKAKSLLVWGEHDRNNPVSNAKKMAERLPDATVAIIKASGHYPHEEQPSAVIAAVSRFLQSSSKAKDHAP